MPPMAASGSIRDCTAVSRGEATHDPALAGRVAGVRRDGYLDIEANSPIAPAEVTVFAPAKATEGDQ